MKNNFTNYLKLRKILLTDNFHNISENLVAKRKYQTWNLLYVLGTSKNWLGKTFTFGWTNKNNLKKTCDGLAPNPRGVYTLLTTSSYKKYFLKGPGVSHVKVLGILVGTCGTPKIWAWQIGSLFGPTRYHFKMGMTAFVYYFLQSKLTRYLASKNSDIPSWTP